MELAGRTALVTGAGRGLGRAVALELAAEGVHVAVVARSQPDVAEVAAAASKRGVRSWAFPGDAADADFMEQCVRRLRDDDGDPAVDIVINNAADVGPVGPTLAVDATDWEQALWVNVVAPFRVVRLTAPAMARRGWGRVVNVSAGAGNGPGVQRANAYSVGKAALNMLTLNLAAELRGTGVTVNAFRPGRLDTEMGSWFRSLPEDVLGPETYAMFHGAGEAKLVDPASSARQLVELLMTERTGEHVAFVNK